MKSFGKLIGFMLTLALLSCAHHKPQEPIADSTKKLEQVIVEQDRVNRYFHARVVPNLLPCWEDVHGNGTISVQIEYQRTGNLWVAGNSSIENSTLAKGEDKTALSCLQAAVRSTSFKVEEGDGEANEYLVHWTLPVPWPKDVKEVVQRMIGTGGGGGGCGGPEGSPPACWDCFYINILGTGISYCARTCAGYSTCTPIPNGCQMGPINPKCVTVSPFGNQGGLVIY
jgi:hypothetical protein